MKVAFMKASNKYLFNQTVDCKNCYHDFQLFDISKEDHWCSMSASTSTIIRTEMSPYYHSHHFKYWAVHVCRSNTIIDGNIPSCGPLGIYYEPKSKNNFKI